MKISSGIIASLFQLVDANTKIKDGAAQITSGVGLAGQASEVQSTMNSITADKDKKIADSFDKDFLLAAIILIVLSFCGLFTDRKSEEKKA